MSLSNRGIRACYDNLVTLKISSRLTNTQSDLQHIQNFPFERIQFFVKAFYRRV